MSRNYYSPVSLRVFSKLFTISNGTRQGCPLSLEPFLNKVRLIPDISELQVGDLHLKISAYADDLLFSLSNPHISLPNLIEELDRFGALSNLKINFAKSEAMGVALPPPLLRTLQLNFNSKWTYSALKYLGTFIPPNPANAFALKFPHLLSKVCVLLDKWHQGLRSWFGPL